MKRLFLNDEEIFISRYSSSIDTQEEDCELFLSVNIKSFEDYNEACKLKNIKPGDVLKLDASNSLVKIDTSFKIKERVSYYMSPDDFLDEIARMCFKFKIEKNIEEAVKDLSNI